MLRDAASQVWPPFVLVAGLLVIGALSEADGLFSWGASWLVRTPGGARALLAAGMALVAVVTAVLNLDTAVVFLTPVLVLAARRRGNAEEPFLYAAIFMANASSLLLPGANLTNLIVLGHEHVSGAVYTERMWPLAIAAAGTTAAGILVLFRRQLTGASQAPGVHARRPGSTAAFTVIAAGTLTIALPNPAPAVLGVALVAGLIAVARRRISPRELVRAASPLPLLGLFALSVGIGTIGRATNAASLLDHAGRIATAAAATIAATAANNLPASVLLSGHTPLHPRALLLGLNVGPNLAVTGSLSAYLWWRCARSLGCRPSPWTFTRHGLVLVPAAIAAALVLQAAVSPERL